jgi:hypothetical protein
MQTGMSRVVEECSEVLKCMESLQAYMCRKCDSYRERNGGGARRGHGSDAWAPLISDCAEYSLHRTANRSKVRRSQHLVK